jgi:hypothetical protein
LDLPCRFGEESGLIERQVNISAGGASFVVMKDMERRFVLNECLDFTFQITGRKFSFETGGNPKKTFNTVKLQKNGLFYNKLDYFRVWKILSYVTIALAYHCKITYNIL